MEMKESKLEMDDSVNKEISDLPKDSVEKSMPCSSNFEDHSFYNIEDHTDGKDEIEDEDEELDILECKGFNDNIKIEVSECNDEYSSSFSGTVSEHESEKASNDEEADSMFCTDTYLPLWMSKKKKLTDHWRRFIQPIMWRCKWVELKIKEFQNQAQMYDKELQESCQAKQLELENLKLEELGTKVLPSLPCYIQKTGVRKRRKRKRVEEVSNVSSYALNHNLFSYYEYRKSFADIALNDNSRSLVKKNKSFKEEAGFCEETPVLEFREGDVYLEQILLKIEAAKLEVSNLKNRVDKVVNENPSRFSLNLLGSADVFTSSEQQKPLLDEKTVISDEKPVKSASVSSHHDTPEEDDETTDILLSEILASKRSKGKATVPDKKLQKTVEEEGPSRTARKRTPSNRLMMMNEETTTNPKRQRVSREKPKSRFKLAKRKRKRGKQRSISAGLRRP